MRSTGPVSSLAAVLAALALVAGCSGPSTAEPQKSASPSSSAPSPSASEPAADDGTVGKAYFGVHDSDPVGASWPEAPVGSLRVWDAGAAWSQVETAPGVFDFTRLDAIVKTAREHKAEVLIVMGQTPAFHASEPSPDAAYGAGASSMPTLDSWKKYVETIVKRYHAPDIQFQVWNEVNVVNYWSGTAEQMAQLTAAARDVIDKIDPNITLVAPAFVTRLPSQQQWMDDFFGQDVDGKPVGDMIDVVSLQLYPVPTTPTAEASMEQLAVDRKILAKHNVDAPVWDTEINYGAQGGKTVKAISDDEQASNVARTYLLNAANGVQRVFWYVWDLNQPIVNTRLVEADQSTPTAAGRAFRTVRKWMVGTTMKGCAVDDAGIYTCTLDKNGITRTVLWKTEGSAQVKVPDGVTSAEKLIGAKVPATAESMITVDQMPVLLREAG